MRLYPFSRERESPSKTSVKRMTSWALTILQISTQCFHPFPEKMVHTSTDREAHPVPTCANRSANRCLSTHQVTPQHVLNPHDTMKACPSESCVFNCNARSISGTHANIWPRRTHDTDSIVMSVQKVLFAVGELHVMHKQQAQ